MLTISPAGVYVHQGFGPRGYTCLQHINANDDKFPLNLAAGDAWVARFEEFAAERGGAWTAEVNSAYEFCFGADLVQLGTMRVRSQLDAYVEIHPFEFTAGLVRENFALLPRAAEGKKIACPDGDDAK